MSAMSIADAAAAAAALWNRDDAIVMTAIAGPESGFRLGAAGDAAQTLYAATGDALYLTWQCNGYCGYGPWQENLRWHYPTLAAFSGSQDPCGMAAWLTASWANAARGARDVFDNQGFAAWSTYNGGQYQAYLADATAAVDAARGAPPAPPSPPPVTQLATSLAGGVSVGVGTVVGLPVTVNNNGAIKATGVVFAAAIDASLLNDLSWEPAPYYYVSGQLMSVLLPDLAPGQQWSGTILIRGRGAASVGIVAKVTAANAPDAIAGTTVRVFSTSAPPTPAPTPAPTPGPVAVLEGGFPLLLAAGLVVGLGYYSWRVEHPRARGKGAVAGLAALVAIPVLPP